MTAKVFSLSMLLTLTVVLSGSLSAQTLPPPPSSRNAVVNAPGEPLPDENLLLNPSFEEKVSALTDEKSLPGWELRFRKNSNEPPLTTNEIVLVNDPAQAHSGNCFLRLQPANRTINLSSPVREGYEPGIYEMSAWLRGRPGTLGGFGVMALKGGANFRGLTGQWQKFKADVYFKGAAKIIPPYISAFYVSVAKAQQAEAGAAVAEKPKDGGPQNIPNPQIDIDDVGLVKLSCGLADVFGDHMVLQREKPVPVWGWAKDANQAVTVKFNGQSVTTASDKDGRWKVTLEPMKAGGPYNLELNGRRVIEDVMVGDVWICSGQSNMQFGVDLLHGIFGHAPEIAAQANYPQLRLWQPSCQWSPAPLHSYTIRQSGALSYQAVWNVCTPQTILRGDWGGFSAIGYFFGREIQADQKVAVGLMMITWGGTPIESFISAGGLQSIPLDQWLVQPPSPEDLTRLTNGLPKLPPDAGAPVPAYAEAITAAAAPNLLRQPGVDYKADYLHPSAVFNGIAAPVIPFAVRGVLWYQGEYNGNRGDLHYETKLKALIADWRAQFGQKDMTFIIAQLCNFGVTGPQHQFVSVRDAELKVSQTVPGTALAVTIDLADKEGDGYGPKNIHPKRKQDVAHRMALAARALAYGEKIVSSGPQYREMKQEGGKIRLTFDSVGAGLDAQGGKLIGFKIAGEDHNFVDADAVIDGDTVLVSAPGVSNPVAVRYAYESFVNPLCTLYNKDGLPASPFRTDDWPPTNVETAKADR